MPRRSVFVSIVLSLTALAAAPPYAAAGAPPAVCSADGALRPLRPWIEDVLRELTPHSPTLTRLTNAVRVSSLVVHLDDDIGSSAPWDGRVQFVTMAGACRYVRISVRPGMAPVRAASVIAHELQHALEIEHGEVTDAEAFGHLFRRIGFAVSHDHVGAYDTEEALNAGLRTALELTGRRAVTQFSTSSR